MCVCVCVKCYSVYISVYEATCLDQSDVAKHIGKLLSCQANKLKLLLTSTLCLHSWTNEFVVIPDFHLTPHNFCVSTKFVDDLSYRKQVHLSQAALPQPLFSISDTFMVIAEKTNKNKKTWFTVVVLLRALMLLSTL